MGGGRPPFVAAGGDVSAAWEDHAAQWLDWARTPGHDTWFSEFNLPAFARLLPDPGPAPTLDIGCGEGRVGRWLAARGHRVHGIDSAPTLVAAAREAGGYEELVDGDAAALPWPDQTFGLAIAFMSLQDADDPARAIGEAARVLVPGGWLCAAILHPLNRPAELLDPYFAETRHAEVITRDGITMMFDSVARPLQYYAAALTEAGLVIEALTEPRPDPDAVRRHPRLAQALERPYFLHLRARLEGA